jgi:hypothetical protein
MIIMPGMQKVLSHVLDFGFSEICYVALFLSLAGAGNCSSQ